MVRGREGLEAPGGRDLSITVSWGVGGDWEMPGKASQKKYYRSRYLEDARKEFTQCTSGAWVWYRPASHPEGLPASRSGV